MRDARNWLAIAFRASLLLAAIAVAGCQPSPVKPEACETPTPECACDAGESDPNYPGAEFCSICLTGSSGRESYCACLLRTRDEQACRCEADRFADGCYDCPDTSTRSLVNEALGKLDVGDTQQGRALLGCAVKDEPGNARATDLIAQLEQDPRDYFRRTVSADTTTYVVQKGETLGKVAEACLGSVDKFVALWRLNGSQVARPRDLLPGTPLEMPGGCAKPMPIPDRELDADAELLPLPAALRAERRGDLEGAHKYALDALAIAPDDQEAQEAERRIRSKLVESLKVKLGEEVPLCEQADDWNRIKELAPDDPEPDIFLRAIDAQCPG